MPSSHKTSNSGKGAGARNRKIARLWCLARDLGLTRDLVYMIVESVTGSVSISALKMRQLNEVNSVLAERLKSEKRRAGRENAPRAGNGVTYMPTPDQRRMAEDLMGKIKVSLKLTDPAAWLEAVCGRTFKTRYGRLSRWQMGKLIEALKSIYRRSQEESDDGSGTGASPAGDAQGREAQDGNAHQGSHGEN